MTRVEAKELKERLGHHLRRVRAGETLLVIERGQPIAELRPLPPAALDLDDRLRDLAAKGVLRLPTRRPSRDVPKVKVPEPSPTRTLVEDREDRGTRMPSPERSL